MALWAQYIAGSGGWADQSGNGRNATLPGGAHNPTIITGDANGHDVFGFAAASQQFVTLPSMSAFTQGEALIVVKINQQPASAGSKTGLWNFSQETSGNATNFPWTDAKVWDTFGLHAGFTPGTDASAIPMATKYLVYGARITTAGVFDSEFNGVAFNHATGFTVGFPAAPVIGGTSWGPYYLDGRVAEVRLYDAVQSTTDRANAVAAMLSSYGAPSADRVTAGFLSAAQIIAAPHPADRVTAGFLSAGQTIAAPGAPPINDRVTAGFLSAGQVIAAPVPVDNDRVTAGWLSVGQVIPVPVTGKPYSYAFIIQ